MKCKATIIFILLSTQKVYYFNLNVFMQKSERVSFGSKLGAILAAAGSAVGLGNIWRFPYEAGNHGGAAFILIYLACVFVLGLPIMIAEFTVGRRSKASTGKAFGVLAPGTPWKWLGFLGVLAGLLILGYSRILPDMPAPIYGQYHHIIDILHLSSWLYALPDKVVLFVF